MEYFSKMRGAGGSPPRVSLTETLLSGVSSFIAIGLVSYLHYKVLAATDALLLIAPFGASAVLIYGAPKSPLAQPRNVIGGHILAAVIGVMVCRLLSGEMWLAASLAVSLAIIVMHLTKTLHPPAGATALFSVIGGPAVHKLGFSFVLMPVAAGAAILVLVGVLVNNAAPNRKYPEFWL